MSQAVRPSTLADLRAMIGESIGPSEWVAVTQDAIDLFAEATGDRQWIHVDPERAARGPFGTTIAHGLYSLSLAPGMSGQLIDHSGFAHSLNYGYEKIRFPAPVPVGSRLRMRLSIVAAEPVAGGGIQLRTSQTIEREGSTKPVLVAENVSRIIPAPAPEDA
ncbi:MAG TPA: MaoC family dehydratase [Pseudonocardiaceae bacterium]|jgi:acyl dehydratase|nr:MaoC family dehydratase [Pseudonocardiaceae bacterium]